MSHAAIKQLAASPAETAHYDSIQPERRPNQVSDLALASAAAQAARTVPGVIDLSSGLVTLAATYGPGQRVTGVVVHHVSPDKPDEVVLEIHVVLSEAHCKTTLAAAVGPVGHDTESLGILTDIANQIRRAVYDTLQDVAAQAPVRVDVLVDDLR